MAFLFVLALPPPSSVMVLKIIAFITNVGIQSLVLEGAEKFLFAKVCVLCLTCLKTTEGLIQGLLFI